MPIVLQTSRTEFRPRAHAEGYSFLRKRSPTLLRDLRRILTDQFGFGDFVFRLPDQTRSRPRQRSERTRRDSCRRSRREPDVPRAAQSLFALADGAHRIRPGAKLRPRKVSDFNGPEHLRRDLIDSITDYRREQSEVLIGDFKPDTSSPPSRVFLRIGRGSLGGKARGLAFVRHLLRTHRIARRFPGVRIAVPPPWFSRRICSTSSSPRTICATSPCTATTTARSSSASSTAPLPGSAAGEPAGISRRGPLSAGGALLQPAGGFAVPALHRRLRNLHAGQPACRLRAAPRGAHRRPSSAFTPRPSASTPRPTCGPRPTAWKKKRWR